MSMLKDVYNAVAGHMPGLMSMHSHQQSGILPRQDTCMKSELDQATEALLPGEKDLVQVTIRACSA